MIFEVLAEMVELFKSGPPSGWPRGLNHCDSFFDVFSIGSNLGSRASIRSKIRFRNKIGL